MARFGSADVKDRFFGAAVYLFAIYDAMALGTVLMVQIPALAPIFSFLQLILFPIAFLYGIFNAIIPLGLGSLVVFFVLFLAVVQNEKISYFIRFNTLQSILFGIAISLFAIIFDALKALAILGGPVFIIAAGASLFCMAECALGRYPEIPTVSAAAHSQLPR
ncbi:MAG: Tic20 family protein [Waterburya sp.]